MGIPIGLIVPPVPDPTLTLNAVDYQAAQDFLRENLSPALTGANWDALLAAVAVGDTYNQQNTRAAFKQLYRSTASAQYLDRRMNDYGVQRPPNVGMSDDVFRDLGIKITNNALTNLALWEVLQSYYGLDTVRASITSGVAEPYVISNGDTLLLKIDERKSVTVTFATADFQNPSAAKAVEVATVINRYLALTHSVVNPTIDTSLEVHKSELESVSSWAVPVVGSDGLNYVRIYSGSIGMVGAVRPLGGKAQNVLLFPTKLAAGDNTTQWTFTFTAATNLVHLAFTGTGTDPLLDNVRVGDYVTIYGSAIDSRNQGTFTITKVSVDGSTSPRPTYVEYTSHVGFTQTITEATATDIVFYRGTRSGSPAARVWTATDGLISAVLPATTEAVNRGAGSAAYLHTQSQLTISSLVRDTNGLVTVTTSAPHGLSTGSVAYIDGAYPPANSGSSVWAVLGAQMVQGRQQHAVVTLNSGQVLAIGGQDSNSLALATVERYDPITRLWNTMAPMGTPRYDHRASLLADGRVLVSGGTGLGGTALATTEVYDPTVNTWTASGSMGAARTAHLSTLLLNHKVLLCGGSPTANTYDIYDPSTGVCTSTLAAGGVNIGHINDVGAPGGGAIALYRFDEATAISPVDATGISNGLSQIGTPVSPVVSGQIGNARQLNLTDTDDAAGVTQAFYTATGMTAAQITALQGDTGGANTTGWTYEAWVKLDSTGFATAQAENDFCSPFCAGNGHTNDLALVYLQANAGGIGAGGHGAVRTLLFEWYSGVGGGKQYDWYDSGGPGGGFAQMFTTYVLPLDTWTHIAFVVSINTGDATKRDINFYANGVWQQSQLALARPSGGAGAGWYFGQDSDHANNDPWPGYLDDLRISGKARTAAEILTSYQRGTGYVIVDVNAAAALMNNGHVLVTGGGVPSSAHAYSFAPENSTWTTQTDMSQGKRRHTATLLTSGKVVLAGGLDDTGTPSAVLEQYTITGPTTGTWAILHALGAARYDHGAALNGAGNLIVVGGHSASVPIGTVEQYIPVADTISYLGALTTARYQFGAIAQLQDGKFEVLGGATASVPLAAAEIYPREDSGGEINGAFPIIKTGASTFTYTTPDSPFTTSCTSGFVLPVQAPIQDLTPGAYIFDPVKGLAITSVSSTVQAAILTGQQSLTLLLTDASKFPDAPGWIVLGFGTPQQQGPIAYSGLSGKTRLMLDQNYVFTADAAIGTDVTWLLQKGPWVPSNVNSIGAFYLTASPAGRVAASNTIDEVVAAGFTVVKTIAYPGDHGLGAEGSPTHGGKLSDIVGVFAGDSVDAEEAAARAN